MGHKSGFRSYPLTTPTRKNFIRTVSRSSNSAKSIARAALSNKKVVKYLSAGIGKQIKFEIKKLCTDQVNSVQKSLNRNDIAEFPWVTVYSEIKEHCPMLLNFLRASTDTATER